MTRILTHDSVPQRHGGDLATARRCFPGAPLPWVDLSTGINPRGYPPGTLSDETWRRLPDTDALSQLERTAAAAYRANCPKTVVAAQGTQTLIQILPRVLPARHAAILGFGYGEHPAVWRDAGVSVAVVGSVGALERADVAVIVNPNNPDGRTCDPDEIVALAQRMAARGGTLVVDEAFADVADPALSLIPHLPECGAIVLRSFGKFFGLAGLRVGFAVAGRAMALRLRTALGPWPVSGPGIAVATRALADAAWQAAERVRLRADAIRLDALLREASIDVVGGTALFRLSASAHAARWFERLGRAGILVRPFAERPHWLRFGLPGDEGEWVRLADALLQGPQP